MALSCCCLAPMLDIAQRIIEQKPCSANPSSQVGDAFDLDQELRTREASDDHCGARRRVPILAYDFKTSGYLQGWTS